MKKLLVLSVCLIFISCDKFYGTDGGSDTGTNKPGEQRESGGSIDVPNQSKPQIPKPEDPELIKPSCESICDNSESIINASDDGYSYLAFSNFGYQRIGRCRGHALMTQRMSILAKFDKSEDCDLSVAKCLNKVKKGINRVFNNGTYTFHGFSNLYELSKHPQLMIYMKNIIKGVSHRYTAGPGYIEDRSFGRRGINTFYELKRRVELNQLPYVGVNGRKVGSHALLVTGVSFISNREVLCARDPNVVLGYAENCDDYFYEDNGRIFYKRHDWAPVYLSYFGLTDDEDKRIKTYTKSLYKSCLVDSKLNNLCK